MVTDGLRPGAAGRTTGQNRALAVAAGCAVPEPAVRVLCLTCDDCANFTRFLVTLLNRVEMEKLSCIQRLTTLSLLDVRAHST